MLTYEKRIRALQLYEQTKSVTETIRVLGYPGRQTLYRWIKEQDAPPREKSTFRSTNTPNHPRHPLVELKLRTLCHCFELGEDVKPVSDEIRYSRAGIYTWRRKYLQKGAVSLMNPADDPRGKLVPGTLTASEEISELKNRIADLQMQVDILAKTLNVLKKDPGAATLRNREKAAIVDALRNRYPLPNLLKALHYARSSYYYENAAKKRVDKYASQRMQIRAIYEQNHPCYGYRRIYLALKKYGIRLSEKVVRRLMRQEQLQPVIKRRHRYS